jgi:hypothetical protein
MKTSGGEKENIKNTHFRHKFGVMEYKLTVPESGRPVVLGLMTRAENSDHRSGSLAGKISYLAFAVDSFFRFVALTFQSFPFLIHQTVAFLHFRRS